MSLSGARVRVSVTVCVPYVLSVSPDTNLLFTQRQNSFDFSSHRPFFISHFDLLRLRVYRDLNKGLLPLAVYLVYALTCHVLTVSHTATHSSQVHSVQRVSDSLSLSLSVCSRFVLYTVYILAKWFHKNEPTALSAPERAGIQTHHTVASVTSAGHLTPNDRELPARGMNHARGEI